MYLNTLANINTIGEYETKKEKYFVKEKEIIIKKRKISTFISGNIEVLIKIYQMTKILQLSAS